jgi:hypothetical protein
MKKYLALKTISLSEWLWDNAIICNFDKHYRREKVWRFFAEKVSRFVGNVVFPAFEEPDKGEVVQAAIETGWYY